MTAPRKKPPSVKKIIKLLELMNSGGGFSNMLSESGKRKVAEAMLEGGKYSCFLGVCNCNPCPRRSK